SAPVVRVLAGAHPLRSGADLADPSPARARMRERVHPHFAQAPELLSPLGEKLGVGRVDRRFAAHRAARLSPAKHIAAASPPDVTCWAATKSPQEHLCSLDFRDLEL